MKKLKFLLAFIVTVFICSCKGNTGSSSADSTAASDSTARKDTIQSEKSAMIKMDSGRESASIANNIQTVKILYGTDRKVVHLADHQVDYGVEASDIKEKYKVGYTTVTIPPDHQPGKIERPISFWIFKLNEDPRKHMIQKTIVQMNDEDFNKLLKDGSKGSDAFIFVHGYNNSFHDAALRTAQLAADINLPIAPIMFSWSSNNKTLSYMRDAENASAAIPAFEDFLKRVAIQGNFKKIHLIAHSMGNQLVSAALLDLKNDPADLKIDQIIMAAPDINAPLFRRDYAAVMVKKSKRITVYSAGNDWALRTSKQLNGHLRLGEVGLPPFVVENVDIIDARNVKTDFLGHGRFAESETIMNDINKLFITGIGPIARGIPHRMENKIPYFYFKRWAKN